MYNLAPIQVPDLAGKTVLITGAGRGIGAATVAALNGAGATVFAGSFGAPAADLGAARLLQLDVTRQGDVDAAIAAVKSETGRLDALINNAGIIAPIGPLASLSSDALAPAFAVNVIGVHRMIVAAMPLLEASQGVVINAGTGAATTPMEGWTAYCTTKAGARMLTQLCQVELGPRGVDFFFLGIPPTDTAMQDEIRGAGLNYISQIPKAELVHPAVSASVLAWLCGPEARSIEGPLLDVRDARFTAMMDLPPA